MKLFAATPTRGKRSIKAATLDRDVQDPLLAATIEGSARRAWGSRVDIAKRTLLLPHDRIHGLASHTEIVGEMLDHVRRVAPSLDIPMMTPRIVTEQLSNAAGQFVEQDGWVKIVVGSDFFDDMRSAVAILCHELCHYVLEANGIRKSSTLENERATDCAIFVFGLGDLFLAGYKVPGTREYRAGHRLGYLLDAEYAFVDEYVRKLRVSEVFLKTTNGRRDDWSWDRSLR